VKSQKRANRTKVNSWNRQDSIFLKLQFKRDVWEKKKIDDPGYGGFRNLKGKKWHQDDTVGTASRIIEKKEKNDFGPGG